MSGILRGEDALNALQSSGGNDNKFSKFSSGSSYLVKVLGMADLEQFFSYGVYKKTHTFIAKNPSTKDSNGFPIDNLTCWDEAFLHIRRPEEDYQSTANREAYNFRAKERYKMGFYDVEAGEPIVIDVSKQQALKLVGEIKENADKLNEVVFRLSKTGSGTSTVVSLSVGDNVVNLKKMKEAGIEASTSLTDEHIANFDNAPDEFDHSLFEGVLFEADEDDMIINLDKAGFDVSILGLTVPEKKEADEGQNEEDEEPEF